MVIIKILKWTGIFSFALAILVILLFTICKEGMKEKDLSSIEDQISLGMKFLNEGEYEQAAAVMTRVIEAKPYLGEAVLAAAEAYRELGKYTLSADYYEKALEMNHMDTEIWFGLENSLIFSKEMDRLKEMYRKSVQLFPSRSSHLEKLIHLCMAEGDSGFIRKLEESLKGSPLQPSVKYGYQAYVLLKEGNVEEAESLLFQQEVSSEIKKSDARLYFGDYNNEGEPHGMGICFYSKKEKDTDIYIGEWKNGRREGRGKAFSSSHLAVHTEEGEMKMIDFGTIIEGNFKEDLPEGNCIITRRYENGTDRSLSVLKAEFCAGYADGQVIMEQYQDSGISLKQEHQVKNGIPQPFNLDKNGVLEEVYEAVYFGEELLAYSSIPCNCAFTWN